MNEFRTDSLASVKKTVFRRHWHFVPYAKQSTVYIPSRLTINKCAEAFQLHICLQQYKSGLKRKLRNGGDDLITHRKRDSLEPIRENQDCERFGNFLDLELERTFQLRIRLQQYKGGLKQK
ncbi:hypothetical protein AVEN_84152-1 [Araneus ventricosus]|uniref:Uncharacterized protein n=1 Tax=Araneus ventricosus TaxID=182803 RepID=A0A4Y2STH0_ARAVE|nr:hypothetical protein AVEN_84152-1 [Araneus ventricosus]